METPDSPKMGKNVNGESLDGVLKEHEGHHADNEHSGWFRTLEGLGPKFGLFAILAAHRSRDTEHQVEGVRTGTVIV